MRLKQHHIKYIMIVLAVIFLVSVSLLLLAIWEGQHGSFNNTDENNGVLTYQGKDYLKKDQLETILVLGLDKYEDQNSADSHKSGIQTDFLMLFVFDNETKQCTAVQINRDTMTKVNKLALGGTSIVESYTKQIALAYNYVSDDNAKIKCGNTVDSVEYLLKNTHIDHYLSVTMDAVVELNDLVGGVEVTVLDDFTGIDDTLIKGQKVTLKGDQALTYVRTRYGMEDSSNIARMERQQQYVNALYEKVNATMAADEEFVLELADAMEEYVVFDASNEKMQKFGEKMAEYQFLGIRDIEGEAKLGEEYIEFYPDEDSIWQIVIDLFYTPKS